jgi:hypothetical protein
MEQTSLLGGASAGGSGGGPSTTSGLANVATLMVAVAGLLSTTAFVSQEWMITNPGTEKHEPASVGLFLICRKVTADPMHGEEMDCESLNNVCFFSLSCVRCSVLPMQACSVCLPVSV